MSAVAAAAKRRYKILKRSDQADPEVRQEIAQLEFDFPELAETPLPALSDATRATLEGGALITSIERGDRPVAAAPAAKVETSSNALPAAVSEPAAATEATITTTTNPDDVKKSIQELAALANKLKNDIDDDDEDQKLQSQVATKQQQQQQQQQAAMDVFFHKASVALQLYDLAHNFPRRCIVGKAEAIAAVLAGVVSAIFHCVHFHGSTLCDPLAMMTNPCWIAALIVFIKEYTGLIVGSDNRQQQDGKKGDDQKRASSLVTGSVRILAALLSTAVRAVCCCVVAFVLYAVFAIVLQGVGLRFPAKYCFEG